MKLAAFKAVGNDSMKRWLIIFLLAAITAAIIGLQCIPWPPERVWTAKKVEQALQSSPGDKKAAVHAWLTGKGWTTFYDGKPIDSRKLDYQDGDMTLAEMAQINPSDVATYTCVRLLSGEQHFLFYSSWNEWEVRIYFFFDGDSRLIKYYIKEIHWML